MKPALVRAFSRAHDKHAQVPDGEDAAVVWVISTGTAATACQHEDSTTAAENDAVVTRLAERWSLGGHSQVPLCKRRLPQNPCNTYGSPHQGGGRAYLGLHKLAPPGASPDCVKPGVGPCDPG